MTPPPTKIVCVGKNFRAHAAELGSAVPSEPLIFLKPPSSLIASGESIVVPQRCGPGRLRRGDRRTDRDEGSTRFGGRSLERD